MRKLVLPVVVPFVAFGLLYACVGDSSSSPPTQDAGQAAPTTSAPTPPKPDASSSGGDAQPDAPPAFTPGDLGSKVVLWLEADRGFSIVDGGVVWKDNSSHGNHARQDDPSRQPVHVDAGLDGSVNGHGAIRFAAHEYLQIEDQASLQWATSDYALYVAMRHMNDPAVQPEYAIVYGKWTDVYPHPGMFLWANYPAGVTTGYATRTDDDRVVWTDGGLNDGKVRIVGVRKTGDRLEIRVDGTKIDELADAGGYDTTGFDAVGKPAYIGGRPALVQALIGDIAELVAVKGNVPDTEQSKIEGFLKAKYGL